MPPREVLPCQSAKPLHPFSAAPCSKAQANTWSPWPSPGHLAAPFQLATEHCSPDLPCQCGTPSGNPTLTARLTSDAAWMDTSEFMAAPSGTHLISLASSLCTCTARAQAHAFRVGKRQEAPGVQGAPIMGGGNSTGWKVPLRALSDSSHPQALKRNTQARRAWPHSQMGSRCAHWQGLHVLPHSRLLCASAHHGQPVQEFVGRARLQVAEFSRIGRGVRLRVKADGLVRSQPVVKVNRVHTDPGRQIPGILQEVERAVPSYHTRCWDRR